MWSVLFFLALSKGCLSMEEDRGYFYQDSYDRPRPYNRPRPYDRPRPPSGRPARPNQPPNYSGSDYEPFIFEGDITKDSSPMKTLYSWKQLDFTFPDNNMREQMIRNQQFIPINTMILDSDIYGKLFILKIFRKNQELEDFVINPLSHPYTTLGGPFLPPLHITLDRPSL